MEKTAVLSTVSKALQKMQDAIEGNGQTQGILACLQKKKKNGKAVLWNTKTHSV